MTVVRKERVLKTQTSAFSDTMLAKELSKVYAFLYGPLCFWPAFEVHGEWSAPYGWPLMAGPLWEAASYLAVVAHSDPDDALGRLLSDVPQSSTAVPSACQIEIYTRS
jgi:hypothetical protein